MDGPTWHNICANHRYIVHAHAFWSEHGPRTWEGKQYGLTETWITDAMLKAKYELIGLVRTSRLRTLINARLNERSETTPPQISGKAQEPISPRNCGGKSDSTSKEEDVESYSSGQNLMELRASRRGYWSRPSFPASSLGRNRLKESSPAISELVSSISTHHSQVLNPFTRAEGHNNVVPNRLGEQLQKMKDADPGWERREMERRKQLQVFKRKQNPMFGKGPSDTRDIIVNISGMAGRVRFKGQRRATDNQPAATLRRSQRIKAQDTSLSRRFHQPGEHGDGLAPTAGSPGLKKKEGRMFGPENTGQGRPLSPSGEGNDAEMEL
ncbi:hypothetical protein D8B26_007656 [Coccidioides posadasii str. Silveira]|uniref:Uncharacterized protein n=1 Tax=Coccidioides posadasii (strain RMSCC 757 / Silveira) TaxID=443226 RepID=E9D2K9_COCPS|nr:conserved hypothetical protein [Coccidioides posadasii str. Silveira]QVM13040.1 hypothetical protein D8B26_007656 [Coccidioides posadasii str. Silveira]